MGEERARSLSRPRAACHAGTQGKFRAWRDPSVDERHLVGHAALVSYAEIIQAVEQLEPAECERLSLHLRHLALLRDPEYIAEMDRRCDDAERGVNLVSKEELLAQLRAAGRNV